MEKNKQLIQIITVISWINTSQTKGQCLFHVYKSIFKHTLHSFLVELSFQMKSFKKM